MSQLASENTRANECRADNVPVIFRIKAQKDSHMELSDHVYCPWMQLFDLLDFPYQFSLKQISEIVLPKST